MVRLPRHQPLALEDDEVVAHGVLVQLRPLRELAQQQAGMSLHLREEAHPARLGETAEVVGAARHAPIIARIGPSWGVLPATAIVLRIA